MALNVISNFAANVAHRNLTVNDRMQTASLAKLSSGTRVVSAKDDAASLAIGSRLNAEVQAQKQAQVNAIQATSMLQVADGAMTKVSDILIRMKTLAVQAGSGQLSDTERGFLDTEYQSLLSEIDRIAADTEFNGVSLIDGSSSTSTVENAQAANNLVSAAAGVQSVVLDNGIGDDVLLVGFDDVTNVLTVTNLTEGTSQGIDIGGTAIATNETQVVDFGTLGVVITLNSAFDKGTSFGGANSVVASTSGVISNVQLAGADSSAGVQALSTNAGTISAAGAGSATMDIGGFTGAFDETSVANGVSVTLTNTDGETIDLTFDIGVALAQNDGHTISMGDLGAVVFGQTSSSGSTDFTYKLGTGSTQNVDDITISVDGVNGDALGLTGSDVALAANADLASADITDAIDTLNGARATIGAAQNRLEFASDNLATTIENSEAARSNLMDLDVAAEMTNFTAKQILVQVGVSMVAQANQVPQALLRLFQ